MFITLEGGEGSGKTTQSLRLVRWLRAQGYRVVETREPGGTPLAEDIRRVLLTSRKELIVSQCEALLILAARSQHVACLVNPALERGSVVVCDRFVDSTLAYQGYARGLDVEPLRKLNRFATGGLNPDLTLYFDVPVSTGLARRRQASLAQNRLDRESVRFHEGVRRGFLALATKEPRRMKVIDGRQRPDEVTRQVQTTVGGFLKKRYPQRKSH